MESLKLSDEELDKLSEITELDINIANSFVQKWIDKMYKNLLLAKSQELAELEEGLIELETTNIRKA